MGSGVPIVYNGDHSREEEFFFGFCYRGRHNRKCLALNKTLYLIGQSLPVVLVQDEAVIEVISRHVAASLCAVLDYISQHPPLTVRLSKMTPRK